MKRGRPKTCDTKPFIDEILLPRSEILIQKDKTAKIVSKSNPIWEEISNKTGQIKTALAIYTFITCNVENVRTELEKRCSVEYEKNNKQDKSISSFG